MTPRHSFDKKQHKFMLQLPQKRLLDTVLTKQHKFMLHIPQKRLLDTILIKTIQSNVEKDRKVLECDC